MHIILVVLLLFLAPLGAVAEVPDDAEPEGTIRYAVRAVLPENQIGDTGSSFHLLMEPGEQQVLEVIVKNKSDEDIEVLLEANTAFTNENGLIEFDALMSGKVTPPVLFSDIVAPAAPVIAIPARSEAVAEFFVTMPKERFEGVLYGGLLFTKLHQEDRRDVSGMGVRNIYRYAIAVRLRENQADVEPDFDLTDVWMDQTGYPALVLHLNNLSPILARDVTLRAHVYENQSENAAVSFEKKYIDIAPNASFQYKIRLVPEKIFVSGDYRVLVQMEYGGQTWEFEQKLSVK